LTLQIVTAVSAGVGARRAAIARRANQVLQAVGSCCEANVVPPGVAPDAIVPAGGAANPHCHRTSSLSFV